MTAVPDGALIDRFLDHATRGQSREAVTIALGLLDDGMPADRVIADFLAPVQREIGERWHGNLVTVAEEHLATAATESALHAIAAADRPEITEGFVVVACAEGDWHSIAAQMFAEQLRSRGVMVANLGASTPIDHVARFIERHRPDALAVSCNLPLFVTGLARLAAASHALDTPVLAGGRALGDGPRRALMLGADAWAPDVDTALQVLAVWRRDGASVSSTPVPLDPVALSLDARSIEFADLAFEELTRRFPSMAAYDRAQLASTREDLAFIVRFAAAARLLDEPEVFTTFLGWLESLLGARGVPTQALVARLEALRPLMVGADRDTADLLDIGIASLS